MTTTVIIPPTSNTGSVSDRNIDSVNDYDFTVSTKNIYTFNVIPNTKPGVSDGYLDFFLYQKNADGMVLVSQGDGGSGKPDVITAILNPGEYRVELGTFFGDIDYTLTASYHPAGNEDYSDFKLSKSYGLGPLDWNSTITSDQLPDHQLVSKGTTIIDFSGNRGDEHDAYSFTVDKPTTVTVNLTPDSASNVDLGLYDDLGNPIAGSFNDVGETDTLTADLKVGTYWVGTIYTSGGNQQSFGESTNLVASYDLSISGERYDLPKTTFRPYNGSPTTLALTFNYNNSYQPETLAVSNAKYGGLISQAAVVRNFAGEENAGILLTTGDANSLLGHNYNQKQGLSTSSAETIKNWSNAGGSSPSMQPVNSTGDKAGFNPDVFKVVSDLVNTQNQSLDSAHQLDPVRAVHDANTLSFDVTVTNPNATHLTFDLMFASEEFPQFANKYVDGAVIMVDGVNYALFNKDDPLSILSVTQSNVDAKYFYANSQLEDGTSVYPTEFNGVSRLISVVAPIVDPTLKTHTVSIAIADTNDHSLDSGIFLTNLDSVDLHRSEYVPPDFPGRDGLFAAAASTTGNDVVVGSEARDFSQSGPGNDDVDSGAGDDVVTAGAGDDTVQGGEGSDWLVGGSGKDQLLGGEGNDVILSGDTNDNLGDNLDGGVGNDAITGSIGADTIIGGVGADSMVGGDGADRFLFATADIVDINSLTGSAVYNSATDFIKDFNPKKGDKIDLSNIDANLAIKGDQAFTLIKGIVFTAPGQLIFDAYHHMLLGNIDADNTPEISILLSGVKSLPASAIIM